MGRDCAAIGFIFGNYLFHGRGIINKKIIKIALLILLASAIAAFFALDLGQYATLDYDKQQQQNLQIYYTGHNFVVLAIYAALYITVVALSLPSSTALTLVGGALFGFWTGLIVVSFASTIGATLAFLMARFLIREWVQGKHGKYIEAMNKEFEEEGGFYLFAIRLVPLFPFFLVNIVMATLPIKTRTFYIVSQLGMLPTSAMYVYTGTELGKISSYADIASPSLWGAFVLLGVFPLMAEKTIKYLRKRRAL